MALTEQEANCIALILPILDARWGSSWQVPSGATLAEVFPSEPTPECVIKNGKMTAAIEVKRLMGDSEWINHQAIWRGLMKSLVPPGGGSFALFPCDGFHLNQITRPLVRRLRSEIARVGPSLAEGESAAVRYPRSGHVALESETGTSESPGLVHCSHVDPAVSALSSQVSGWFMLVDEDDAGRLRWKHSFVTDRTRDDFALALIAACERRLAGEATPFSWFEEWELKCLERSGEDGVEILAVTEARSVPGAANENLVTIMSAVLKKFDRRWADKHVVILENKFFRFCDAEHVRAMLADCTSQDLPNLDLIAVVDEGEASVVWTPPAR
jgi:hypothetical protein